MIRYWLKLPKEVRRFILGSLTIFLAICVIFLPYVVMREVDSIYHNFAITIFAGYQTFFICWKLLHRVHQAYKNQ